MLAFEWPWLWLLLPLPLLIALAPAARREYSAIRVPFFNDLSQLTTTGRPKSQRHWWRLLWLSLVWLCLLTAAARPHWVGQPISLPTAGRDLLLAVDISGSMETADMVLGDQRADRISAVKAVVSEFVERRQNDRLGLILFGTQAYLQAPLTFDRATVKTLLQEAQLGFAGEKTAIGDAIGLATKRLMDRPQESRILILLTDGANTAGAVEPRRAASLAQEADIKIYTIGVGAEELVLPGPFGGMLGGRKVNPSADLDEATLQHIADTTGGRYFRARDINELNQIYHELDKLEPVEQAAESFRPKQALFYWPLGAALIISALWAGLGVWGSARLSGGGAQAGHRPLNTSATEKALG